MNTLLRIRVALVLLPAARGPQRPRTGPRFSAGSRRAKAIISDCEASLVALGGLPIDVYLIHSPDPRTPWRTSVRALARLLDEGLVRRVGLSNVNRRKLDEALELAPTSCERWRDVRRACCRRRHRCARSARLEPPAVDEGFTSVEVLAFVRNVPSGPARTGVFVAAAALRAPGWEDALKGVDRDAPHLVFDWRPDGAPDALDPCVARVSAAVSGPVASALCPHAGGPPSCWCRPPLPGLLLALARARNLEPSRSMLVVAGLAHRMLAAALGARYISV